MKAYTTEDGRIVRFRPYLNAERMENSAERLEMPVFPQDRFVQAVVDTVKANAAYVPPYGSGATLYIPVPYMFGTNPSSALNRLMSTSSVYLQHLWAHISKAVLSL